LATARRRPASRWQRACSGRRWWPLSAPRDVTYMETTASKSGIRVKISLCCAGDCAIWSDGIAGFLGTHEVGLLLTTIDGIGPQASARLVASFGDFPGVSHRRRRGRLSRSASGAAAFGKSASACLLSNRLGVDRYGAHSGTRSRLLGSCRPAPSGTRAASLHSFPRAGSARAHHGPGSMDQAAAWPARRSRRGSLIAASRNSLCGADWPRASVPGSVTSRCRASRGVPESARAVRSCRASRPCAIRFDVGGVDEQIREGLLHECIDGQSAHDD